MRGDLCDFKQGFFSYLSYLHNYVCKVYHTMIFFFFFFSLSNIKETRAVTNPAKFFTVSIWSFLAKVMQKSPLGICSESLFSAGIYTPRCLHCSRHVNTLGYIGVKLQPHSTKFTPTVDRLKLIPFLSKLPTNPHNLH